MSLEEGRRPPCCPPCPLHLPYQLPQGRKGATPVPFRQAYILQTAWTRKSLHVSGQTFQNTLLPHRLFAGPGTSLSHLWWWGARGLRQAALLPGGAELTLEGSFPPGRGQHWGLAHWQSLPLPGQAQDRDRDSLCLQRVLLLVH